MKKVIMILLSSVMALQMVACSTATAPAGVSENAKESSSSAQSKNENELKAENDGKSITVDNMTITIVKAEKKAVVGDRTSDNFAKENGEYFADGTDIVKAADYENIVITVKVDSKADKAITFNEMGWSAVMVDGYKLKPITVDGDIKGQIPSNYSGESTVNILVKKSLNVSTLKLNYSFIDYNDEWSTALKDTIQNSLSESQFKAKYGNKFTPKEMLFNINI